jgi:PAS domain S-box-containing protein
MRILADIFSNALKRMRGEAALRESESRFRLMANTAPVMIWMSGADKLCTYFNKPWLDFTGRSMEEELGNGWVEGVHPEDLQRCVDTYKQSFDQREEFRMEYRLRRHDGEYRWILDNGVPRFDQHGFFVGYIGSCIDVTDGKLAEIELSLANDRLRLAMKSGKSVGWEWDVKTGQNRWFGDLETVFGIPNDTSVGDETDFRNRVYRDDQELVRNAVADARSSRKPYAAEFRVVRVDGGVRWVTATGNFYYGANGDPERMLGLVVDITERKQVDQKLHESEDRFAGIVNSAMDAIIVIDDQQRIIVFNAAAEKMFGCPAQDAIGNSIERFIPQRFRAEHKDHVRRFGETGATRRVMGTLPTLSALRATGEQFPIEASISKLESSGRKWFTVIIRDVTERRQVQEALRESEQRFRLVADTAPVLIWMSGPDKLRDYFNRSWLDFTGRPLQAEVGNGWAEGVHPEDLIASRKAYTSAFDRRESFEIQYRLRRYDGEYRWVADFGVPRINADGSFAGYIGSCIDLTDHKLAEETVSNANRRLIEAQEQERTRIARELHDDINQQLALLSIEIDQLKLNPSRSAADIVEITSKLSRKAREIAGEIQSISHQLHSSKLEYLGIVAAMRSFCDELAEQHKAEIDFSHNDIPATLPKEVSLCLFRVLQEALRNAIKHSGVRQFKVNLKSTSDEVHLTVADSGVGFDPVAALNKRGLGLVSMRERVRLVNGAISIESKRGDTIIHARVPYVSGSGSEEAAA